MKKTLLYDRFLCALVEGLCHMARISSLLAYAVIGGELELLMEGADGSGTCCGAGSIR